MTAAGSDLALEHGDLVPQDQDLGVLGTVGAGEQGKPVPDCEIPTQPDAQLGNPSSSTRHLLSGRDGVIGTHTLLPSSIAGGGRLVR